jgi:hypothetical protein
VDSSRKPLEPAGFLAGYLVKLRPDYPVSLDLNFGQRAQASGTGRIFGRIFGFLQTGLSGFSVSQVYAMVFASDRGTDFPGRIFHLRPDISQNRIIRPS